MRSGHASIIPRDARRSSLQGRSERSSTTESATDDDADRSHHHRDHESEDDALADDLGQWPAATREMAVYAGLVHGATDEWGDQYIYCVYLNNLSVAQRDRIHQAFLANPAYLGYTRTTYSSAFRTFVSMELPTAFIKHKRVVLLDHGLDDPFVSDRNDIGYPFAGTA
jgi:hypothetical protein